MASTIYESDGAGAADSDCTPGAGSNEVAPLTRTDTTITGGTVPADTTEVTASWTTPTNEPNSSDWANADYRVSTDVTTLGADLSFTNALLRVNSTCTIQETLGTSSAHGSTGVFVDTFTVDPSSGAASDRFQHRVTGTNVHMHNNEQLAMRMTAGDTFMEWQIVPDPSLPHNPYHSVQHRAYRASLRRC